MRLVTDLISGKEVNKALDILKFSAQEASRRMEKLLLSAIANWQAKNEGARVEESNLYVKNVHVDSGRVLKRLQTAPQGRAYRLKKRSTHVTLVLDSMKVEVEKASN
jgi:large subunit ribosomal protein L22